MRPRSWRRGDAATQPVLVLPSGVGVDDVESLLRRYDPELVRRRSRLRVVGDARVQMRRGMLRVMGDDRLARGIGRHLGGDWQVAPAAPTDEEEPIEDMLRVYVPHPLLPAELATLLEPVRQNVRIREDPNLANLFWFDDDDSPLNVSAWAVTGGPAALGRMRESAALFECGIDDVTGPDKESAAEAWEIATLLEDRFGAVAVDRYGFRVTCAEDLLPR